MSWPIFALFFIPIFLLAIFIFVTAFKTIINVSQYVNKDLTYDNINEWSYQRFERFYGNLIPSDKDFKNKLDTIFKLISENERDVKVISEKSNCTIAECISKIHYLQNKRILKTFYVDTQNMLLTPCTDDELKLIKKYALYIYIKHSSIDEITSSLSFSCQENMDNIRKEVLKDIKYLTDKNLLNGVIFNSVDEKLIYYSVEKHNHEKDLLTLNCPNCGALVDVNRHSKNRCAYCKTIVEDKEKEV